MPNVEQSISIHVPPKTAFERWSRFDQVPEFVNELETFRQIDKNHFRWVAQVDSHRLEGVVEITEQIPDRKIAWRSIAGFPNSGAVLFTPTDYQNTTVTVQVLCQPSHPFTNSKAITAALDQCLQTSLNHFRQLLKQSEALSDHPRLVPAQPEYDSSGKSGL
jgi:uncharacterized membrane protein